MRNSRGQTGHPINDSERTTDDTRNVSKIKLYVPPAQAELLDHIRFHGVLSLASSLKLIHDLALYHTDVSINEEEKSALFDLKLLWEGFERIGQEA